MMIPRCFLIFFLFLIFSLDPVLPSELENTPSTEEMAIKSSNYSFGGWMDLLYLTGNLEREEDDYLDSPHMYAFADLMFNRQWRAFVEVRRVNAPGLVDKTSFERLYLEYRHSIPLKIRVGRINTPAGLWQHMHWAYTIDSTEKPLIEQKHFFPTESDGIHILGTKVFGSKEMEYSFFTNYSGKNQEKGSKDEFGYGFDWNLGLWHRTKTGLFYLNFKDDGMGSDPTPGTRDVFLLYNETHLVPDKLLWRTEYLKLKRPGINSLDGIYSKIRYNINGKWYLNLRFDSSEDTSEGALERQTIYTHKAQTVTVGFQPTTFLRLRAEYSQQQKSQPEAYDFEHISIWAGIRF